MIITGQFGWKKRQGSQCIQSESQQHPSLIGIFPDKHGSWKSHCKIAAIKSHLHQRAVSHTHPEDFRESLDHRVCNIVGKSPQSETCGYQDK